MNPPEKAVVFLVEEKSQIQALDLTQPGLPLQKGRAAAMTHDYKRNGTTVLSTALDAKTGNVIAECLPCHRAQEFPTPFVWTKSADVMLSKVDRVRANLDAVRKREACVGVGTRAES